MGRVLVQQWISADGMVAGPGGEDDVFAAVSDFPSSDRHNTALLDSVDEVLLGRRTYELFVAYWPTAADEALAPLINTRPRTVASTTLRAAPWGTHAPAEVVPDALAHVRGRREAGGTGTTIVWGSIDLARSLLAAGLVDEVELFVAPVLLGAGRPLLDGTGPAARLALRESEVWPGGTVRSRYAVGGAAAA